MYLANVLFGSTDAVHDDIFDLCIQAFSAVRGLNPSDTNFLYINTMMYQQRLKIEKMRKDIRRRPGREVGSDSSERLCSRR